MSTINVNIADSSYGTTIDYDRMYERLKHVRAGLERAIAHDPDHATQLQDRINKVDSQIDRLNAYRDKTVTITPERAAQELSRGLKQIEDGQNYLAGLGLEDRWSTAAGATLENWRSHLAKMQGRLDSMG